MCACMQVVCASLPACRVFQLRSTLQEYGQPEGQHQTSFPVSDTKNNKRSRVFFFSLSKLPEIFELFFSPFYSEKKHSTTICSPNRVALRRHGTDGKRDFTDVFTFCQFRTTSRARLVSDMH